MGAGADAVSASVEGQVVKSTRLAGDTACGTSKEVAEFCLSQGMTVAHMGVASGSLYQDASVAGVALCGKMNSTVILMDGDNGPENNDMYRFVATHKGELQKSCYVFGGTSAVSETVWNKILAANK